MYLEHFGLSEAPFRITPHTEFFFAGANRGATLDALIYAIIHDEGIVKVSGEVGSGKTMLCRVLMERLPRHVAIVYLANPSLSRDDIVFAIAEDLGLALPENARTSTMIRALQEELIELHSEHRQVVVLIDEAHAMPIEALEEIRLLSNLETSQHKLLQLVLFGQPELDGILSRPDMRQLRERITQNFALEPLRRDDIAQYLDFRMRTAGYRGPEVFSPAAVKSIASASQGLTRRINILAEKSLLAAFAEGAHLITTKQVHVAVRDAQYANPGQSVRRWLLVLAATIVAALAVLAAMTLMPESTSPEPTAPIETAPAQAAVNPPVPPPTEGPSAAQPTPSPAATVAAQTPDAKSDSESTSPPRANPVELRMTADTLLNSAMMARVKESRRWIDATDGGRWFVQMVTTNATEADFVRHFVARADALLGPEHVRLYVADTGKEQRIGIIYGEFLNLPAANLAIEGFPAELQLNKPFPRQVMRLK